MKMVRIYTDGACSGNPGPGGWGAVLMYAEQVKEIYGGEPNTTNQRMEIKAVIEALKTLKVNDWEVTVYSDRGSPAGASNGSAGGFSIFCPQPPPAMSNL